MKLLKLLSILMLFPFLILAQKKEVKLVVGVEAGTILRSYQYEFGGGWNYDYGLNLEYPIKKFSVGFGVLQRSYGGIDFEEHTGEFIIKDEETRYTFYQSQFNLNYLVISNRLQFRLPCNCVFFHAGYNFEILRDLNPERINNRLRGTGEEPYELEETADLKKVNTSIELGLGFKMHLNDYWRIFFRPTYNITNRPSNESNRFFSLKYRHLRMAFGLQLGI